MSAAKGKTINNDQKAKWNDITARTYAGQAKWFLNGFWEEMKGEAEKTWDFVALCAKVDIAKKAAGNELDEFQAHQFLEQLGETLTVQEMRNKLRDIDIDFNKRMALIEYLIFRYNKGVTEVINAPQGGENKEELAEATRLVAEAQVSLEQVQQKLAEQKQALASQKEAHAEAERTKHAAEQAERAAHQAKQEQEAALAELQAQEKAKADQIAVLEKKSTEGSTVSKGTAVQQLEALRGEDPLPLRRAKINQGATVRKAEKAAQFAKWEADKARLALSAAEVATRKAEEATRQVEAAVKECEAKLQAALDFVEEVKKKPGASFGDLWWLEREIYEKRKYLPRHKGGI